MTRTSKKKLIETSLPLEAINEASGREKSLRQGLPSTMHLWWSRKPLATSRAIIFAQLVDDPTARPDEFPTVEAQDAERARLHRLITRLALWENSNDAALLEQARIEIKKSNDGKLPGVTDPFAGGGSIPLEAARLGLPASAADLNPVAVLLNKALIEIPARFAGMPPVSPRSTDRGFSWGGTLGLAEDVRLYGEWVREAAFEQIGHLYPKITEADGTQREVLAWKWARVVTSPNPANPVDAPLVNSWWLAKKKGKEAWVRPYLDGQKLRYEVVHSSDGPRSVNDGTVGRSGAISYIDKTPISLDYVRKTAQAGNMRYRMMAVIAKGDRQRIYRTVTAEDEELAAVVRPTDAPQQQTPVAGLGVSVQNYGIDHWSDLFTDRQLTAMTTFSSLVRRARSEVLRDALESGMSHGIALDQGGDGALAYSEAVGTYLALAVSKLAEYNNTLCRWMSQPKNELVGSSFSMLAITMAWDFAEANVFCSSSGSWDAVLKPVAKSIEYLPSSVTGTAVMRDAAQADYPSNVVVSTDPPYYDTVGYADMADFFYVWLREELADVYPTLFSTLLTPKDQELVANPHRLGGKSHARDFFISGFNEVFRNIRRGMSTHDGVPLTVYYAYKQTETDGNGKVSTGWHTLLDGLVNSGWEITATWPVRSERGGRMRGVSSNALASSIVLACRPRPEDAAAITRRTFISMLKAELPGSLRTLMLGGIAPVDLAQAAIGPGISVFSRYSRVREADGSDMSVKDALILVNATLDEVIGDQESDFDSDTRFAIKWYRQYGWERENSGIADQLARSSDTSVGTLERGGIFEAKGGKARLLAPSQLDGAWDAAADDRVSVWEATVRLAAVMAKDGADKVAELLPTVQTRVNLDAVKELGFLLFLEAEKKNDSKDAGLFNGLVSAWSDLSERARRLAAEAPRMGSQQTFDIDDMEG
ncbi:DUF1156 domain-containing protein [Cryobacterium sp. N19]|uniref:DUF1156 domain-containing protein n=1 Tax=Cryobacterium sp. N19 TaxID=2048288 RepID=UPI000CE4D540|nr:DUF1156 domain-containing protein [Cryobacterium sp. N19]